MTNTDGMFHYTSIIIEPKIILSIFKDIKNIIIRYNTLLKSLWTFGFQLLCKPKISITYNIQQFLNIANLTFLFISNYTPHKNH